MKKNNNINNFGVIFPIVNKFFAKTFAAGGWSVESEERIKRRIRVQKLKRVLDKNTFENIVSKSEYDEIMRKDIVYEDGLVSVQPMSLPTVGLYYIDFKYETDSENKRKSREKKINRILDEKINKNFTI